jgi:hydroxymethylpyrimidine pyrophosphatase-like HAD family hydrolase
MTKGKGWIALDIDGTITLDKYSVPREVTAYLRQLHQEGWNITLVTGRPFAFASMALTEFDFPYILMPQNGSIALEMPAKKVLFKKYISSTVIPLVEQAYVGIDSDFLVYAGYEKGDFCYWRPQRFSKDDLQYLEDLQQRQKEKWQAVDRFNPAQMGDFPLIKCFGPKHRMEKVATRLKATHLFQIAHIRDPFVEDYTILLVTDQKASKGASLTELTHLKGRGALIIAAGDDENDISLLQAADIKIAMAHAPESLQEVASFIAPPTKEHGIIKALQMATRDAN